MRYLDLKFECISSNRRYEPLKSVHFPYRECMVGGGGGGGGVTSSMGINSTCTSQYTQTGDILYEPHEYILTVQSNNVD